MAQCKSCFITIVQLQRKRIETSVQGLHRPNVRSGIKLRLSFVMVAGALAALLCACAAPWLARPTATPLPAPTATAILVPTPVVRAWPQVASPSYSIQVFMWWRPDLGERDLGLVQDMGFGWVKQRFAWRDIEETAPGVFNWARPEQLVQLVQDRNLKLIALLDYPPYWAMPVDPNSTADTGPPADYATFGSFCTAFAQHFKGKVAAYQVWNEPNLAREWGGKAPDPAAYSRLLRVCYMGIKSADPAAIVISAGLAPTGTEPPIAMPHDAFLRAMYAAGAQPYFDMLGVHAPGYLAPPWVSSAQVQAELPLGGNRWMAFRHVEDMRALMLEYDDPQKQVAILETGWTTDPVNPDYSWFAVSEAQQAEYMAGAYKWAREHWRPWVGIMNAIYIADPQWVPEQEQYWWAITTPGEPLPGLRPAYRALRDMPK